MAAGVCVRQGRLLSNLYLFVWLGVGCCGVVVVVVWWLAVVVGCGNAFLFDSLSLCLARLRPPLQIDSAALSSADAANHIPIPTRSVVTTNTRLNVLSP